MNLRPAGWPTWISVCVVFFVTISESAGQQSWPRFRGAAATGVAADHPRLPTTWSATENVAWSTEIPGWGWSCPVVWGNNVFLTTVVPDEENEKPKKGLYLGQGRREPPKGDHHWLVYCLELDSGDVLWKHEAHVGRPV
ncbi:MAG: serine/threonine protein kinase, partial [Pirellulaceae bacterium]|nr:serine/threonine protein kinase [Pirellulaceae bacterium]